MAQPVVDSVLINARLNIADRRRRLRGAEAVTADVDPAVLEAEI